MFIESWGRYKTIMDVVEVADIRLELHGACSDRANRVMFENVGAEVLDTCREEDILLKHVKSVVVKSIHKEVLILIFLVFLFYL